MKQDNERRFKVIDGNRDEMLMQKLIDVIERKLSHEEFRALLNTPKPDLKKVDNKK